MNNLVSIIVLSYNSEQFIVETLESIVNQSYNNIEIIIADDSSKDNSVKVAQDYLNSIKFKRFKIVGSNENRGIPANCNSALNVAEGEYIKFIAADDILIKDCINKNILFMESNKNNIQFTKMLNFTNEDGEIIKSESDFKFDANINNKSVKKQFSRIVFENFIPAPTVFFRKCIFDKYGVFNEKYKLFEDYPMWVNILYNKEKVYFLDEVTVLYRQHNNSLSNSSIIHINEDMYKYYKEYINSEFKECLLKEKKYLSLYHKKIDLLKIDKIIKNGNIKGKSEKGIKWYNLLDPLWILNKLKLF